MGRDLLSRKILLVEDNPQNAKLMKTWLEADGYSNVCHARDGEEGINIAFALLPDIVLLDAMLPILDGFQVARTLKADPRTNPIPIIMVTALSDQKSRLSALESGAEEFLSKPVDRYELRARVRNLLKLKAYGDQLANSNRMLEERVQQRTRQLHDSHKEAILILSKAAEHRDEETGRHVVRVSRYAVTLANKMGLGEEYTDTLFNATPMHDVGKIGIPDQILLKPGPLTPEEWTVMRNHTLFGHQILSNTTSPYLSMGAEISLFHHERFDGTGYPYGVRGTLIPLCARIMTVCDQYDALRSARPYKPALPHDHVVGILTEGDGRTKPTHFDPEVLEAFDFCQGEFAEIHRREN